MSIYLPAYILINEYIYIYYLATMDEGDVTYGEFLKA